MSDILVKNTLKLKIDREKDPENLKKLLLPDSPSDYVVVSLEGFDLGQLVLPNPNKIFHPNYENKVGGAGSKLISTLHPLSVWILARDPQHGHLMFNMAEFFGYSFDEPLHIDLSRIFCIAGFPTILWDRLYYAFSGSPEVQAPDGSIVPGKPGIYTRIENYRAKGQEKVDSLAKGITGLIQVARGTVPEEPVKGIKRSR